MRDDERSAAQYDKMAADYAADNRANIFNALFERPATIELLGNVERKRILEVGCGAGPLTEWLVDRAAHVTAMDVSPEMLRIARHRLGNRAQFVQASLDRPLGFVADGAADLIVASLVLHYVKDWNPVFSEFRRVLGPEGVVVFSTHHPAMDWQLHSPDDYFAIRQVTETWTVGPRSYPVTFWRRPLTAITEAISSAGFVIERMLEPPPSPAIWDRDAEVANQLATEPSFLFFRLRLVRAQT